MHQQATAPALRGQLHTRELHYVDITAVTELLADLPQLYPGGDTWLQRRLVDVLAGDARCTLVGFDKHLAGLSIETPKAADRIKLSTFMIASEYRGNGIGTWFAQRLWRRWLDEQISQVHVTVDEHQHEPLAHVLAPVGFLTVARMADRYGPGRTECVMTCIPTEHTRR